MQPMLINRAFRLAVAWQSLAIVAVALLAASLAGAEGFLSALVGGSIGLIGYLVFRYFSARPIHSPTVAIRVALRAEAAKIIAIILMLWASFTAYHHMVVIAFMFAFTVSVLIAGIVATLTTDSRNSFGSQNV
jgi:ATP synthase protein I